jgi:hypothetical protein
MHAKATLVGVTTVVTGSFITKRRHHGFDIELQLTAVRKRCQYTPMRASPSAINKLQIVINPRCFHLLESAADLSDDAAV